MKFDEWLNLVYVNEEIPLRGGQSKHQAKIREIIDKIKAQDMLGLLNTSLIPCPDNRSEIVDYCKYLQHMINVLKDEGQTETIVSKKSEVEP